MDDIAEGEGEEQEDDHFVITTARNDEATRRTDASFIRDGDSGSDIEHESV